MFEIGTSDVRRLGAAGIVAASGSFSNPYAPVFPGQEEIYRPTDARRRVSQPRVFCGPAGDRRRRGRFRCQIANELAPVADVTVAARHPLRFIPQRIGGHDVHYWLRETGFDSLPAEWLRKISGGNVVTESVGFQETLAAGLLADVRPMFIGLDGDEVVWGEDERERVDLIMLATGYRPSLD